MPAEKMLRPRPGRAAARLVNSHGESEFSSTAPGRRLQNVASTDIELSTVTANAEDSKGDSPVTVSSYQSVRVNCGQGADDDICVDAEKGYIVL